MRSHFLGLLSVVILIVTSCCSDVVVTSIPEDHARLKAVATVYGYACRNLGRPPKRVEELLPILEQATIQNPQNYFKSTRDGYPYTILWGLDLEGRHLASKTPLAYERVGHQGKRLVVLCNHQVQELAESEFRQIVWPTEAEPGALP